MVSFERVVQLRVPLASGRTGIGSGTLVGDRLVLTAEHVVRSGAGDGLVQQVEVLLPALDERVAGRPVWSGLAVGLDAALVELDAAPRGISGHRPVRWGRLTGQRPGVAASAIGFPRSLRQDDGQRVSEQPSGRVNPGVGFGSRYDLLVDPPHPLAAAEDPSPWSGLSGAALVADEQNLLIGVALLDVPNFQSGRLSCVPVWRLLQDPDFRDRLAEHDVAAVWQSVELDGLFEPEPWRTDSPAGLLRADAAVVRFRGRQGALEQLQQWCAAEERLSVALVSGPGGQGKTRLARQLRDELREVGWVAGFSRTLLPGDPLPALAKSQMPVLVVVDYAEIQPEQLRRLVAAASDPNKSVRVLLLARSPGEWWSDLKSQWRSTAGKPLELALPALEDTEDGRQQAYNQAVQDLAGALPRLSAQSGINWTAQTDQASRVPSVPDLTAPAFESVLTIQLLALTGLLSGGHATAGSSDPAALEEELLEHEQRYWQEVVARRPELPALQPLTLRRAVATATLCGAGSEDQAVATLSRVVGLRDRSEDEHLGLVRWLADLYPSAEGRYWGSLQPDRVGEHLIGQVTRERPAILVEVLAGAGGEQGYQALTVLTRAAAAQPHLPPLMDEVISAHLAQLGPIAVQVALQAAAPEPLLHAVRSAALNANQPQQLHALLHALPQRSLLLAQTSLEIQQQAVDLTRRAAAAEGETYLPELAGLLNNLANRLGEVGKDDEGLAAAREAVKFFRELAGLNRVAHLPELAMSVNSLANLLSRVEERDEALVCAREAVKLYRELVKSDRAAYLPGLAVSVNNFAIQLGVMGKRDEGLTAAREAVDLRRELVELDRDAYLPGLAASVNNLAIRLTEAGQRADALAAAKEAVGSYRKLVRLNRDAYLPELAMSVSSLAVRLAEMGEHGEALAVAQEGVKFYRELVGLNRDAYLPELAMSVSSLATRLAEVGQRGEGPVAAQEVVDFYRELVELNRGVYLQALAGSWHNLALQLGEAGRGGEALVAAQDAVESYRELIGSDRTAYLPHLAGSVSILATQLAEVGQRGEALAVAQEAVEFYRELVEFNRDAFLPALVATQRAVKSYQEPVQAEPKLYGLADGENEPRRVVRIRRGARIRWHLGVAWSGRRWRVWRSRWRRRETAGGG